MSKLVYNKESRNENGVFYRNKTDWEIKVPDDFSKDNFTEVEPPDGKCDWDETTQTWIVDDTIDQSTLDAMTSISKLKLLEALDELSEERAKFDILMTDATFNERWIATTELLLDHPLTQQALAQVGFDTDKIKREIIKQG